METLTYVSEGFLDFFKKKSKEPPKVEKSNISDAMKPANPLIDVNTKLMEMYPEDTAKEFKKRKAFLKELLNVITEANKKFKDIPGIDFNYYIELLKLFIQEKDYIGTQTYNSEYYSDFTFMHNLIPSVLPKYKNDETYGWNSNWQFNIFDYSIWDWAKECKYKDEFASNKRLVRDFDDTREWWGILETLAKWFDTKLKSSEFVYMVDCSGDWDDGMYSITLKPSKEIQKLAERCSNSYKSF